MADVKLHLDLVNVYEKPLGEKVDIVLRHQVLNEVRRTSVTTKKAEIRGLRGAPQGLYKIEIDPPSYQNVTQFVNMKASGVTSLRFQFPIDPSKVKKVNFPVYANVSGNLQTLLENSDKVLSFEGRKGKDL